MPEFLLLSSSLPVTKTCNAILTTCWLVSRVCVRSLRHCLLACESPLQASALTAAVTATVTRRRTRATVTRRGRGRAATCPTARGRAAAGAGCVTSRSTRRAAPAAPPAGWGRRATRRVSTAGRPRWTAGGACATPATRGGGATASVRGTGRATRARRGVSANRGRAARSANCSGVRATCTTAPCTGRVTAPTRRVSVCRVRTLHFCFEFI